MNQNRQLNVNWFNINVPTILAVIGTAIGLVKYIDSIDDRTETLTNSVSDIKTQLQSLNDIPFRVLTSEGLINQLDARQKESSTQLNARIDRISETVVNAFEVIRKDIGSLSTDVQVQSNKIDNLSDKVDKMDSKPKPTGFRQ